MLAEEEARALIYRQDEKKKKKKKNEKKIHGKTRTTPGGLQAPAQLINKINKTDFLT